VEGKTDTGHANKNKKRKRIYRGFDLIGRLKWEVCVMGAGYVSAF